MNIIYANNQEVITFIAKAQNKIADLATLLVERAGDISPLNILALELVDFIEALDNPLATWTLEEVLRWIHEYNYRANLGELSYLNLYGYNTTLINNIVGGSSGNITVNNISDFDLGVNNLLRKFPHNSLAQIQGGTPTERYHIDKLMYDLLYNLAHPSTPSTVSLSLTTNGFIWPSGYYELGASIEVVNLKGSINYGTDNKANYFEYQKNGVLLGSRNSSPTINLQPNSTSDITGVKVDTSYSFNAEFKDGLKKDTKSVQFRQPMYYGVIKRKSGEYNIISDIQSKGTKDVRDRGAMDLTFNIAAGNTLLKYEESFTPFLFIPATWNKFTSAINATFEFVNDWSAFGYSMILADGSRVDGILIIYNTQIEGLATFKFNWDGSSPVVNPNPPVTTQPTTAGQFTTNFNNNF